MENENKGTVENVKVEGTGKVETQTTNQNEVQAEVKTLTQKEVDEIVKERLEREKKKLPSKEELDEFKKFKESQKTEAEKQAEIQRQLVLKETETNNLKNENTILRKGVNSDDIDYVLFKVGKMEGEFETNLDNFLKENPKYLGQAKEVITTGVKTQGTVTQESGVMGILRSKHPELFN